MKIMILNGPNINLLGIREPQIYGRTSYADLLEMIRVHAQQRGIEVECYQSNHEGDLVDAIQRTYFERFDGLVFNPAAYTHTSIAIADAIKGVSIPTVEVHLSDVNSREAFRQTSYIRPLVLATIAGHGTNGYLEAIDLLIAHLDPGLSGSEPEPKDPAAAAEEIEAVRS